MDIHKNARTTPHSRMLMVQRLASGWTVAAVAAAALALDLIAPGHLPTQRERLLVGHPDLWKEVAGVKPRQHGRVDHVSLDDVIMPVNGKAERFIQTSLREWAHARAFQTSAERAAALLPWLTDDNFQRPHSALGGRPPIRRVAASPGPVSFSVPESDPESLFGRVAGVEPRAATAEGGLGLTPEARPQAQ
jgi:hypothetical protein